MDNEYTHLNIVPMEKSTPCIVRIKHLFEISKIDNEMPTTDLEKQELLEKLKNRERTISLILNHLNFYVFTAEVIEDLEAVVHELQVYVICRRTMIT